MADRLTRWERRYGDCIDRIGAAELELAIRRGVAIESVLMLDNRAAEIDRETRERQTLEAYQR